MANDSQINLIGNVIEVTDSQNKSLIGKKGKIIMETKNSIQLDNGIKLLKSHVTIRINEEIVHGSSLIGRLDSRVKKTRSKL